MNGEYLSYYPQFESNQVLTSAHLNEMRQYLDEQIRLTRSQLTGVGIAAGLTFQVVEPTSLERKEPEMAYDYGIRLFAGFGVSSEGFLIGIEGERMMEENPEDPYRSIRFSDYISYRVYKDESHDLYWHYWKKGKEGTPTQTPVIELLTKRDKEQLILDGVKKETIKDLTKAKVEDKVLVLYLEQKDIALRTCVGKDCDNKGSKRYITPRVLLLDRPAEPPKPIDPEIVRSAEITMTGLDGLLLRMPYPKPLRVPRLITALNANATPLQKITDYLPIGNGYLAAIAGWKEKLAKGIRQAHFDYGPFLGLTDKGLEHLTALESMSFPKDVAQYALDFLKDLARCLNEFALLAYQLKRDTCNEGYLFARHLMLGTVIRDATFNQHTYDRYRNYFHRFALTWDQGRRLRTAQLQFERMLQLIKLFVARPDNQLVDDLCARVIPSAEDEYPVGKGAIPDYYAVDANLPLVWDPERSMDGLHDEVLSFRPSQYSTKDHVLRPLNHDIDDQPFLRIQNLLGQDKSAAVDALRSSKERHNLAFEVVAVKLAPNLSQEELSELALRDQEFAILEAQYQSLRVGIHALVGAWRASVAGLDIAGLQSGLALPGDLIHRFIVQTPVAENVMFALSAPTLLDFLRKDGLPASVRGVIPPRGSDALADLFQHMYQELRTFAQYLVLILEHKIARSLRQPSDACDQTEKVEGLRKMEMALSTLHSFLADTGWVGLQGVVARGGARLLLLESGSSRLFHNFAQLHPGIEHLGGVYKGGTYVLAYEERIRSKGDWLHDYHNEIFEEEGLLDGPSKPVEARVDASMFRAEFDLDAIFDDREASGELWMDAGFDPGLENTDLKGFIMGILGKLPEPPLSPTESLGMRSSKVENLLVAFYNAMGKRDVAINVEFEAETIKSLLKGIKSGYPETTPTVQQLLPGYIEFVAPGTDPKDVLGDFGPSVEGEYTPEPEIKDGPFGEDGPEPEKEGGPAPVTKRELEALAGILVRVLERADQGFLSPAQMDLLDDSTAFTLWQDYLNVVQKSASEPLSPAARAKLRTQFLSELLNVPAEKWMDEGIQDTTWSQYVGSIAKDVPFVVVQVVPGVDALLEFLRSQLLDFGQLSFSGKDIAFLQRSDVEGIFDAYLEIYTKALRERHLDLDIQRNLLSGFIGQLEAADADLAQEKGYAKFLDDYIEKLKKDLQRIAPNIWVSEEGNESLMDTLLGIFKDVLGSEDLQDRLPRGLSLPELDAKGLKDPSYLWPAFEAALLDLNGSLRGDEVPLIKEAYLHALRKLALEGKLGVKLTGHVSDYTTYLGAAGPDDNPYMRQELLAVIGDLAGRYGISGKAIQLLDDQSVASIWPQFLRTFMRSKLSLDGSPDSPLDASVAEGIQQEYTALLIAANRKHLRELGIESQWFAYVGALLNEPLAGIDWVGRLVAYVSGQLQDLFPDAVAPAVFAALRLVNLDAVVPTFEDEFRDKDGEPLDGRGRHMVRQQVVGRLRDSFLPFRHPVEIGALWESYLDGLSPLNDLPTIQKVVVADFSLPYRVDPELTALVTDRPSVAPPLLFTSGDIAVIAPGQSADIRLLANDGHAMAHPVDQDSNVKVRILNVMAPPGALGGKAFLIADPLSPLLTKPLNVLRFEAAFGIPLEGGEVVEVTYELLNEVTRQTAIGKVLILIRQPLGLITDPCCCCKDYTFVLTQGEDLRIPEPYLEFADRMPFVLRLLDEKGDELQEIAKPEFRAKVHAGEGYVSVEADPFFEGTLRLPYRVRYEGGRAVCEGIITVLVVCDCMRLPCEITTTIKAEDGSAVGEIDVLNDREKEVGLAVMLQDADEKPVDHLDRPVPRIRKIGVQEVEKKTNRHVLEFEVDGTDAGSARVTFLKGHWVQDQFVVVGECTLVILIFADEQCFSFARVDAAGGEVVVKTALTAQEIADGLTTLSFGTHGISANYLGDSPGVLSLQIVRVEDEMGTYDAFLVKPDPKFRGEFRFDFYKGKGGRRFEVLGHCNMTLEIKVDKPDDPGDEPIVRNYTVIEDHTLLIDDMISQDEADSGLHLRVLPTQVGNESLLGENLRTRISLFPLIPAPDGAMYLHVVPNPRLGGRIDTAFLLQPIFGYNGPVTWKYEKYKVAGTEVQVAESGDIIVQVTPEVDCEILVKAKPGEDILYETALSLKEQENGYELRFFTGIAFNIDLGEKIEGVEQIDLQRDGNERFTRWHVKLQPEAFGEIRFRIAAGRDDDHGFSAVRICTVTILVEPAELPPSIDLVPLAWGENKFGQTNIPADLAGSTAVAAGGSFSLALRRDGTVAGWGSNLFGESFPPEGLPVVKAIAAGKFHAMALTQYGTVVVWGRKDEGQADVPSLLHSVTAIAAGGGHCLALRSDGTVVAWGENSFGQSEPPKDLVGVKAIAAGERHSLALLDDGSVIAWGDNRLGQCEVPKSMVDVVDIKGGTGHSIAMLKNGTVVAWGDDKAGQSTPPPALGPVAAIAAGGNNSMALLTSGLVTVWGDNSAGQLDVPRYLGDVEAISVGDGHILVLAPDFNPKVAVAWGQDMYGQTDIPLELNDIVSVEAADAYTIAIDTRGALHAFGTFGLGRWELPKQMKDVKMVRVGAEHVAVLLTDGRVFAFGSNEAGQLDVPGDAIDVRTLGAGAYHNVALRNDGTVVAWGDNKQGQCEVPKDLVDVKSIRVGQYHTLALKRNGTVVAWGLNADGQCEVPKDLGAVKAIAVGKFRSAAIRQNGTVVAWGMNVQGESSPPPTLTGVKALTLRGAHHTLALLENGGVVAWGYNANGQCNVPFEMGPAIAIAAGAHHSLALLQDGSVAAWGDNGQGQCIVPRKARGVTQIAAGDYHSVALIPAYVFDEGGSGLRDKFAVAWGRNYEGQVEVPEGLTNINTVSVGAYHNLALRNDGTVAAWGYNLNGQSSVPPDLVDVKQVVAAVFHSVALKNDGSVVVWGYTGNGLGDVPKDLVNVVAIATRYDHCLALNADGSVVAWGDNNHGQCEVPPTLNGVKAIAAGAAFSVALLQAGTVVAWGNNDYGQCEVPRNLTAVKEILVGDDFVVALQMDGKVVVWGNNQYARNDVPFDLTGVVSISSSGNHILALKDDGKVVAWGENNFGQCNVPITLDSAVKVAAGFYHSVALMQGGYVMAWGYNANGEASAPFISGEVTEIHAGIYHTVALVPVDTVRT